MGCRCSERANAMRRVVGNTVRGDFRTVRDDVGFVAHTLVADARSGDLRRAAVAKLAQLRGRRR